MPFPASAARFEVHGAGAVTGGSDVTRVAGCHGGGEGGRGGCGGTGHPARATGAELVAVDVVVDVVAGARERGGRPDGRVVGSGPCLGAGAPPVWLELSGVAGGGESDPEVAANVATDATTARSTIAAAGHQRFSPGDKGTSHSGECPHRTLGTAGGFCPY
ncbi:MAG TPA: hypothetical protein VK773_00020 [Acidimicrobiales bacterium]|nr:hypothetical protein [Acidimicrobiales bacterium]